MAKRAIRFQKQHKNRLKAQSKRSVLSYDDAPLEEYEKALRKPVLSKHVTRVTVILLLCALSVFLWMNRQNLAPNRVADWVQDAVLGMGVGGGYPAPVVGSEISQGNFQLMDKDVAALSDTSFVVLNRTAKELCNRQHSFGTPVLKTDGNMAVVYNQGGKGLQIETKSKNILKTILNYNIQAASISQAGVCAALTGSKVDLSEMTVFSKENASDYLYKYYFSEYYMTDVAINSAGTAAAAVGVSAQAGALKSVVYVFDFKSDKPLVKFEYEDNLMLSVQYLSNGNIVAVGDKLTSVINMSNRTKTDYSYQQKTLASFSVNSGQGILLALSSSSDGRACDLVLLDKAGNMQKEFATGLKTNSIAYKDDMLAVLSAGTIYGYSASGQQRGSWNAGSDARKILLYTSQNAYVLGISEIRSVPLN